MAQGKRRRGQDMPGNVASRETDTSNVFRQRARVAEAAEAPDSNRTKKSRDLTNRRRQVCPWPCKVFSHDRTKMFHVKHF
jgi:hypothetical protein